MKSVPYLKYCNQITVMIQFHFKVYLCQDNDSILYHISSIYSWNSLWFPALVSFPPSFFLWQRKPPFPDPLKLCAPQMTFNCIRGSCDMGLWRGGIFGGGSAGAALSLPPAHIWGVCGALIARRSDEGEGDWERLKRLICLCVCWGWIEL